MLLMAEDIRLYAGGSHQSPWIDDFERVVGEMHYLLFAEELQRPTDVNVGETKCLTDLTLTEWELNRRPRLGREAASDPDIELQEQMCNALPGVSKTDVGKVVMGARSIGGDLTAKQNGETRIGLNDDVQLPPREGVDAHYREAPGGMIHRGLRRRLKPKDRTRKCEIQNLAGAII